MALTITAYKNNTVSSISGTTFTSNGTPFAASDVGRCIVMTSGNATGFMRKIVGYTSTTVVTVDYAWNVSPFADFTNAATDAAFAEVNPVSTDAWSMSTFFDDVDDTTNLEKLGSVGDNVYELNGTNVLTIASGAFLYDTDVTFYCNTQYVGIVNGGFIRLGDIDEYGNVFNGCHLIDIAPDWSVRSWTNETTGDGGDLHLYNCLVSITNGADGTGILWALFEGADAIHRIIGTTINGDFGMRISGDESIIKDVLVQGQSASPIVDAGINPVGLIGMINNINNVTKNNVLFWQHQYGSFIAKNVEFFGITSTLIYSNGSEVQTGSVIGWDADQVEALPSIINVNEASASSVLTLKNPIVTSVVDLSLSVITDSYKRVIWNSADTTVSDSTVTDGDWDAFDGTWWTIALTSTGLKTKANGTTTTPYNQAIISYNYLPNTLVETLRQPSTAQFTGITDTGITQTTKATVDAYTAISNGERFYDRSKSWTFDNFDDQFPSQGGLLVTAIGATLDLGAVDLVIDGGAASAFAVSQTGSGTITIDAGATFTAGGFNVIETTGDVTIEDATVVDDWTFDSNVYLNAALDLTDVIISGDLHINTGANSTLDFSNVTISGDVYNDDASHTLLITKNSASTVVAADPGVGNGETNIQQLVPVKIIVKDAQTLDLLENARVLIRADTGGDLPSLESVTITRSVSTATVTHTAHGLANNMYVIIKGAVQNEYNGSHQITYISANSYSYTVSGTPTSPATGTITSTARLVNELTDSFGEVNATMNYTSDQPIVGIARKATP